MAQSTCRERERCSWSCPGKVDGLLSPQSHLLSCLLPLWILCLPITTQTDVLPTLLSHQALSGECSSFSPQHSWSRTLPKGAFPREHTGASSAYTAASLTCLGMCFQIPWCRSSVVVPKDRRALGLTPCTKAYHIVGVTTGGTEGTGCRFHILENVRGCPCLWPQPF